jgi:hypothetical protein
VVLVRSDGHELCFREYELPHKFCSEAVDTSEGIRFRHLLFANDDVQTRLILVHRIQNDLDQSVVQWLLMIMPILFYFIFFCVYCIDMIVLPDVFLRV